MVTVTELNYMKAEARKKIVESSRDLLSLKITLPLGNPNLKNVHTNMFLFTELPKEFDLANFTSISEVLQSNLTRWSGYTVNRWYIEGTTIDNKGSEAKITLDLNPFSSSLSKYGEDKRSMVKAYNDAISSNNSSNSSSGKAKSTSTNSTISKSEPEIIQKAVAKIIKNETNELKKAKKIHGWLIKHCPYSAYSDSKYSSAVAVYKAVTNGKKVNCADTSRLSRSMFACAGLKSNVRHISGHYFTEMRCNGKWYCSDATSRQRKFNWYFVCKGCNNKKYTSRVGKNNGKNPES